MRINLSFIILILFFLVSCRNTPIQQAIKQAGENGRELQKVLDYYSKNKDDSLKFKSAVYLIENMQYHYGIEQTLYCEGQIADSVGWYKYGLSHIFVQDDEHMKMYGKAVDSLNIKIVKGDARWDIETVTADMLIENIDYAFLAWEMPWCKHLGFDEFCEYILPYRCLTEPLTYWRKYFYEKYAYIKDSLPANCNSLEACIYLQNILKKDVFWSGKYSRFYSGVLPPVMFENVKVAACENLACYTSLVMRAVGIPVLYDKVLYWRDLNIGHGYNWLVTNDSIKGRLFSVTDGPPEYSEKSNGTPKVFRQTYKIRDNTLWHMLLKGEDVAPGLFSPYQVDVTHQYCLTDTLIVKPDESEISTKLYWLCMINKRKIVAVNYSFLQNNGKLCFPNTTLNIKYTLGVFKSGILEPVGNPFFFLDNHIKYGIVQMDSLMNYKIEKRYWENADHSRNEKTKIYQIKYWNKGWHEVPVVGKLVKISTKNSKPVLHYEIILTGVPKGAFFKMNSGEWFYFNNDGEYQKL